MIRVYLGDIDTMDDAKEDAFAAAIPKERAERLNRYRRKADRKRSIGAAALLAAALGGYLKKRYPKPSERGTQKGIGAWNIYRIDYSDISASDWPGMEQMETVNGPHGKPGLREYPDMHFNLSHSGSKAMLVWSDRETGCDIEAVGPVREGVMRKAFSEEEKAYVSSAEEKEQGRRFTEVWVRKESFLKAVGIGIDTDLSAWSVIGKDGLPVNHIKSQDGVYVFGQVKEEDGYLYCFCVRRGNRGEKKEKQA